jgi:hypothetical protein
MLKTTKTFQGIVTVQIIKLKIKKIKNKTHTHQSYGDENTSSSINTLDLFRNFGLVILTISFFIVYQIQSEVM